MTPPPPFSSDTTAAATAAERVLETFRSDGIAVARFDELFGEELWQEAVADITPFVAETDARRPSSADRTTERPRARRRTR